MSRRRTASQCIFPAGVDSCRWRTAGAAPTTPRRSATPPATSSSTATVRASAASRRHGRRTRPPSQSPPGTHGNQARSFSTLPTLARTTRWSPTRYSASAAPGPGARSGFPPQSPAALPSPRRSDEPCSPRPQSGCAANCTNRSPSPSAADNSKTCGRGAEAGDDREPPVPPGSQSFVNSQLVTFTVVGGALFWIPNRDQLRLLVGGDDPWQRVQRISTSQVRRYRDMPVDGTLFQEVSNSRAYYVSAGHCWYVSAEQFRRRGFKSEKIRKVPDGGLRQCPYAGDLPPLAVTKAPLSPPRTSPPSTAPPKNCDPAYPDDCLQDGIGDWDCADGSGNGPNYVEGPLTVRPPDPFDLDRNHNGVGCEERNS